MQTKVIFRWWKGRVVAIFPEVAATMDAFYCLCFEHLGQHSAADPYLVIRASRPATQAEYTPLRRELEDIYGYELHVVYANTQGFFNIRRQAIERSPTC